MVACAALERPLALLQETDAFTANWAMPVQLVVLPPEQTTMIRDANAALRPNVLKVTSVRISNASATRLLVKHWDLHVAATRPLSVVDILRMVAMIHPMTVPIVAATHFFQTTVGWQVSVNVLPHARQSET